MQGVRRGNFLIAQPRNPFAWSAVDPLTRQKVITVESGLGTLVPDLIHPGASCSIGPGIAAMGAAAPVSATWPLPTSNGLFVPFYVTVPVTVYQLFTANGATVAGNVDVGIYDADRNLIISSGSTAQAGVNSLQLYNVTDTELDSGTYYLALTEDDATSTFIRWTVVTNHLTNVLGVRYVQSDVHPLPSTLTFAILSASVQATIPIFGALVRNAA